MLTSHFLFLGHIIVLYLLFFPVLTVFLKVTCCCNACSPWLLTGISISRWESGLRLFLDLWKLDQVLKEPRGREEWFWHKWSQVTQIEKLYLQWVMDQTRSPSPSILLYCFPQKASIEYSHWICPFSLHFFLLLLEDGRGDTKLLVRLFWKRLCYHGLGAGGLA